MRTPALLSATSVLAAIQGTAHGASFLTAKPRNGAVEVAVIDAMKANAFAFGGATRSYWDFYTGYGIEAAAVCIIEAAIIWQLANLAAIRPALVRPTLLILAFANVAHVALIWRYFFYLPAVFDAAIAAGLVCALIVAVPAQST